MLNQSRVLSFVKSNLGFPYVHIELTDEEILENIIDYTLREFSQYVPEKTKMYVNLGLAANKVPGVQNEYYINDPENLEILNVVEIYFSGADYYVHGHPPFGAFTFGDLQEWALQTEMAGMVRSFSSFEKTFEFKHPNIVRISSMMNADEGCTVEYERIQPPSLRGIPNEFQILFSNFALADIMILLGRIRKKYGGNMRTPFGEIPIESDILDEGKEKKREIIEKLERLCLPNVTMDFA